MKHASILIALLTLITFHNVRGQTPEVSDNEKEEKIEWVEHRKVIRKDVHISFKTPLLLIVQKRGDVVRLRYNPSLVSGGSNELVEMEISVFRNSTNLPFKELAGKVDRVLTKLGIQKISSMRKTAIIENGRTYTCTIQKSGGRFYKMILKEGRDGKHFLVSHPIDIDNRISEKLLKSLKIE